MDVQLQSLLPDPLREQDLQQSQIWQHDLLLKAGECYEMRATSGKGKSTFLSILFGIRTDYSGQVLLGGTEARTLSRSAWAQLRQSSLSMVFQGLDLFPALTAMENIQLKNRLSQCLTAEEIRAFAEQLEVQAYLDKPIGKMSFGQQQRIAIIRSLAQPFDWLLLDEPFSHLDPALTQRAWELIRARAAQQQAGLIITSLHDPQLEGLQTRML